MVETAARRLALEAMGKAVSARLNADRSDEGGAPVRLCPGGGVCRAPGEDVHDRVGFDDA